MSQHTQGKLYTGIYDPPDTHWVDIGPLGISDGIARVRGCDKETNVANAERLVACWNEFEGLDTDQIPGSVARLVEAVNTLLDKLVFTDEEGLIEHAEPMIAVRAALAPFERKENQP